MAVYKQKRKCAYEEGQDKKSEIVPSTFTRKLWPSDTKIKIKCVSGITLKLIQFTLWKFWNTENMTWNNTNNITGKL
jgi:hypothetical protein